MLSLLTRWSLASLLCFTLGACKEKDKSAAKQPTSSGGVMDFSVTVPKRIVTDIDQSEKAARSIAKFVRGRLLDPIAEQQFGKISAVFSPDFAGRWPAVDTYEKVQTGTIAIHELRNRGKVQDAQAFQFAIKDSFEDSAVMQRRAWKIFEVRIDAENPMLVYVRAHLLLAGKDQKGQRYQLEADVQLVAKGSDDVWSIQRWDFKEATWSVVRESLFRDISASAGFKFYDSKATKKVAQALVDMRRLFAGGGLTVYDSNQDGFWDILSTRKGRGARLFVNDGMGAFSSRKIHSKHRDEDAANFYLALDINNDSQKDLVSTHVEYDSAQKAALALYQRKGRRYVENKSAFVFDVPNGLRELDYSALVSCDVNSDGRLDVIALGYLHGESGGAEFNLVDGHDGLRNLLFINQGKGKFRESALAWGLKETQYSYVAECHDFDRDGDYDLFVGNDYGSNNYYENIEGKRFEPQLDHPFASSRGFTMGFSMADIDNTGEWSVALSNMYSHAGNRIVPLVSQLGSQMQESILALAGGNNLFRKTTEGWKDFGTSLGLNYAEWAWGNILFDYDNDGDKDQYVVNGFTTHSDPTAPDF